VRARNLGWLLVLGLAAPGVAAGDVATSVPVDQVASGDGTADEVVVRKAERKLYLLRAGQILRSYDIALGKNPEGHKEREGDLRTPRASTRSTGASTTATSTWRSTSPTRTSRTGAPQVAGASTRAE
jgi:hypothetical protein